jgi:hypothetical protein
MDEKKCYKCKKKRKFEILEECKCGIFYCIKHRFHDCSVKSEKLVLPDKIQAIKIQKI